MTVEEALCIVHYRGTGVPVENYKKWEELQREAQKIVSSVALGLINKHKEGK